LDNIAGLNMLVSKWMCSKKWEMCSWNGKLWS